MTIFTSIMLISTTITTNNTAFILVMFLILIVLHHINDHDTGIVTAGVPTLILTTRRVRVCGGKTDTRTTHRRVVIKRGDDCRRTRFLRIVVLVGVETEVVGLVSMATTTVVVNVGISVGAH